MIENFEDRAKLVFALKQAHIKDARIIEAIESIDRANFVDGVFKKRAYEDVPLPIEAGQTISAPSVVARMTEALELDGKCKVLEIGTGSGYQAAVLGKLSRRVYTTERIKSLVKIADLRIGALGLHNVMVVFTDGSFGLPQQAPFDRILLTAAVEDVPAPLLAQLKIGGIMVLPVGLEDKGQTLIKVKKTEAGLEYSELGAVRFVPLLPGRD